MTKPPTLADPAGAPSVIDIEAMCGRLRELHQRLHKPLDYPGDHERLQIALAHADAMIFQLGIAGPSSALIKAHEALEAFVLYHERLIGASALELLSGEWPEEKVILANGRAALTNPASEDTAKD